MTGVSRSSSPRLHQLHDGGGGEGFAQGCDVELGLRRHRLIGAGGAVALEVGHLADLDDGHRQARDALGGHLGGDKAVDLSGVQGCLGAATPGQQEEAAQGDQQDKRRRRCVFIVLLRSSRASWTVPHLQEV